MTKYLIGFAVLLLAGWTAYRAFGNLQGKKPSDENLNDAIMSAAREMAGDDAPNSKAVDLTLEAEQGDGPMPLFIGAEWKYRVTDSREAGMPRTYLLKLDKAPDNGTVGMLSAGFDGAVHSYPVRDRDGDQRIDGLGYLSPPMFGDGKNAEVEGETLPRRTRFIEGAAWELRSRRPVTYELADKHGLAKPHTGIAEERHRALAGKIESIAVPAGKFDARRVDWISRIEIRTDNRPVLMPLTAEPYRKETMWVVPGIGIIKREISFLTGQGVGKVVFELVSGPR
jgi:hypothetical protein